MDYLIERLNRIEELLLNQKTILNIEELARYASLSTSHLYKLTSRGDIPHYKPTGKKLYFKKDEIDEWLLRNKKNSHDEIDDMAENYLLGGTQ